MAKPSMVMIALAVMANAAFGGVDDQPPPSADGDPLRGGTAMGQPGATEPAPAQGGVDVDALVAEARARAPAIKDFALGALRRARRSISIGPTVGVWGDAILEPGNVDAALTFGLGLEKFDVPVIPSIEDVQELIVDRAKAQLKQRIVDVFQGRQPEPLELQQLAAQVYADVRDEILGVGNTRPKTMERPSFSLAVEANRLFGAERWLARTRAGFGIWKFTLGVSLAVGRVCRSATCDDGVKLFSGPEVVVHFLTSKNPRASVVDAFLRADFQATSRGTETYDQLVLGARYLLDLI